RALQQLGARFLQPRPRHVQADPVAQAAFKARLRPLLREVATAFPHSIVEMWATDEHRIGLKPILHKVWCVDGQRPLAPVRHRYEWRYLVNSAFCWFSGRHPTLDKSCRLHLDLSAFIGKVNHIPLMTQSRNLACGSLATLLCYYCGQAGA